jgi:hypothetical protein
MILKNIINFFNISLVVLLLIFIFLINMFLISLEIKKKFALLLVLLVLVSCIGFYYLLDGFVMMFLLTEITLVLIFITMFSQIYSYNCQNLKYKNLFFVIIVFLINLTYYEVKIINYKSYYSHYNILLNDFYYIYNTFFEKEILLTIIVTITITLYSFFFILFYFNLKNNIHNHKNFKKNLYLLRKQSVIHQSNYNNKINFFNN